MQGAAIFFLPADSGFNSLSTNGLAVAWRYANYARLCIIMHAGLRQRGDRRLIRQPPRRANAAEQIEYRCTLSEPVSESIREGVREKARNLGRRGGLNEPVAVEGVLSIGGQRRPAIPYSF